MAAFYFLPGCIGFISISYPYKFNILSNKSIGHVFCSFSIWERNCLLTPRLAAATSKRIPVVALKALNKA